MPGDTNVIKLEDNDKHKIYDSDVIEGEERNGIRVGT